MSIPVPSSNPGRLEAAIDHLQQAVLVAGHLKRTHDAAADDLAALFQSLSAALDALRTIAGRS